MSNEEADLNITVLAFSEEATDENLEELVGALTDAGIVTECTLVFADKELGSEAASEDNLAKWMTKDGWYSGIVDFWWGARVL